MKTRAFVFALALALHPAFAISQSQPAPSILVKAARLLDVRKGAYIENAGIWVEGERIKEVGPASDIQSHASKDVKVIDLGRATIVPGLIDCHTHIMARMPETDDSYTLALATKSQAFRALEGAFNARLTLSAGFTTIRDVENEGSGYADVALRDAIEQGVAEGPRMQVATRAIAAVGQYEPFGISPDLLNFPTGAQMVSGVEEARRAAREQIGRGADLIKVYADWQHPTLTVDEMRVIVEEAHQQKLKVAAHATTPEGIKNALMAGVDSIELWAPRHPGESRDDEGQRNISGSHGRCDRCDFRAHQERPDDPTRCEWREALLRDIQQELPQAMRLGVEIASGFDAAVPARQGRNADELVALNKRGMRPMEVIRAATLNAAELMNWQDRVGAIETGKYADLIAVEGDPLTDIAVLQQVKFVMKGGTVVKDTLTR